MKYSILIYENMEKPRNYYFWIKNSKENKIILNELKIILKKLEKIKDNGYQYLYLMDEEKSLTPSECSLVEKVMSNNDLLSFQTINHLDINNFNSLKSSYRGILNQEFQDEIINYLFES